MPTVLPADERKKIALILAKRVTAPSCKEWRTGDDAMREIKKARDRFLYEPADLDKMEKFIQELCWRDYWQLIWKEKNNRIVRIPSWSG
mgnify:CR=1 FL=1